MFDIGWSELVVIGVVALIAIGPKELPGVLRAVGQWVGKIKRMAADFQGQFQEAMREAEVADLKKQFDDASSAATNFTSGFDNPLENAKNQIESSFKDSVTPPTPDVVTRPTPEAPAETSAAPSAAAEVPPPPDIPAPEPKPEGTPETKRGDAA
jgi:sec-independent protein translocase protein TatB